MLPHAHDHAAHEYGLVAPDAPQTAAPVLVEATRGDLVETVHRGRAAVVAPDGQVVLAWGDPDGPVYPRSTIKPLQAIPLVESGAADAFALSDAEIALACASHGGEPRHVATVERWLARIGLSVADLECGSHWPLDPAATQAMQRAGRKPTAAHNNCSGKHAGMLTTARHLGEPTRGYIAPTHAAQQRLLGLMEQMAGVRLDKAPRGVDGCGIPVWGMPLGNLALAFARFADPARLPEARAAAIGRIQRAMVAEPFMVAGTDRFCTQVVEAAGKDILLKSGAAGMYAAALPRLGLGVAVKIEDGNGTAAEVALGATLSRLGLLDGARGKALAKRLRPPILNRAGLVVGEMRPAPTLAG